MKWQEMVGLLEVTEWAILLWRRGERRPSGANILAITELARSIPGGIDLLCQGDVGALTLWTKNGDTRGNDRE